MIMPNSKLIYINDLAHKRKPPAGQNVPLAVKNSLFYIQPS